MPQLVEQCSSCGGGPLRTVECNRERSNVRELKTHCVNCGAVDEVPKEERHW